VFGAVQNMHQKVPESICVTVMPGVRCSFYFKELKEHDSRRSVRCTWTNRTAPNTVASEVRI